jgi:hypothetical protein
LGFKRGFESLRWFKSVFFAVSKECFVMVSSSGSYISNILESSGHLAESTSHVPESSSHVAKSSIGILRVFSEVFLDFFRFFLCFLRVNGFLRVFCG